LTVIPAETTIRARRGRGCEMKVSVEEFFQDFYERQVFHSIIAEQDIKWAYIDAAYNSILEKDESFSSVDIDVFRKEMIAVRMEMVGLAFAYSIKDREKLLNQSIFTKN
jgi:hypothetical protein